MTDTYWRDNAACLNNSEPFDTDGRWAEAEAKRICSGCSVRLACLTAALEEERGLSASHRFIVRGGLNGTERAELIAGAVA